MKLDKVNYKILSNLDFNARIPVTLLAKKVNISKQNLNYRLKKLIENKVILGFISVINVHSLSYLTYRLYLRYKSIKKEEEQKIIDYFKKHENVLWFVSTTGSYDLELIFVARNYIHFSNILKKIREDQGNFFSKYNISMSIANYHFKRDYLLNEKRSLFTKKYYGFEPSKENIDSLDIKILTELSRNCRQNSQEIGRKLNITYHTVKDRIKKLEDKNIIQYHRILIDIDKINRKYYKALIKLNANKNQEEDIYNFCCHYNFIVYLVEVLGDWQLDIEAEVESQDQFNNFLREFRNKFSDLITDYEILQVTKEHKLNYFPVEKDITENYQSY